MAVSVFQVSVSDRTQPQNNICQQEEEEEARGCQSLKIRMSD